MIKINNENFKSEIVGSDKPALLAFTAAWCMPCKHMTGIVEQLSQEQDAVKMGSVDIEESPQLAAQMGITNIPVLVFFKDGQPVDRIIGTKSKKAVIKMISK